MTVPSADALARFGRRCFALSLVGFGVANFVAGDFVAGRAPAWPAGLPGRLVWAYFTGVLFITTGLRILHGRDAVRAALVASGMIAAWALLRHLPLVAADRQLGGAWTNFGKALALSGGALGVAALVLWSVASAAGAEASDRNAARLHLIARCLLGAFLVIAGIQHFLFAPFVATLVPAWIPGASFWTHFAGAALIAGGVGLALPLTSRIAAALVGAMVFTWLLVLHIPRGIAMNNQNEWTAVLEALAFSGIAFALVARPQRTADA